MPPLTSDFFPASQESTSKILSVVVFAILAGVAVITRSYLAAGAGVCIVGLTYAYAPRGYAIRDGAILIHRLAGKVRIPLASIRQARAAAADDLAGAIRLWGSGGLFGHYGIFRNSKLGTSTWYVTDRRHAVVLATDSKTVVLSPDEVERFLDAIRPFAVVSTPPPGAPPDGLASTR